MLEILSKKLEENLEGYEFYDIEILKQYGQKILRVYIDSPNGITLNDCETVSRAFNLILDALEEKEPEIIKEAGLTDNYVLEISSPGIERKLIKPEHFYSNIGKNILVILKEPINGSKKYVGELLSYDSGALILKTIESATFETPTNNIKSCRLVVKDLNG